MMIGVFKENEIVTVGGTVPQGEGVEIVGAINDWTIVEVPEDKISSLQEFNIQYISNDIAEAIDKPQQEGAYNAPAYKIENIGDKLRFETNPNQVAVGIEGVEDGTKLTSPDEMDDKTQKNFTSEDVKPYKRAYSTIKKLENKEILRTKIRGNVKDLEDDLADMKIMSQALLYYFINEAKDGNKNISKYEKSMTVLSNKLLNDDLTLRVDLSNGIDKLVQIIEDENKISEIITVNYSK